MTYKWQDLTPTDVRGEDYASGAVPMTEVLRSLAILDSVMRDVARAWETGNEDLFTQFVGDLHATFKRVEGDR